MMVSSREQTRDIGAYRVTYLDSGEEWSEGLLDDGLQSGADQGHRGVQGDVSITEDDRCFLKIIAV